MKDFFDDALPSVETLSTLLKKEQFDDIFEHANSLRKEHFGEAVYIRALLEFSNHCNRQCLYCGLNCKNKTLHRFRMAEEDIITSALEAWEAGYKTIVLQSGEDSYFSAKRLGEIVKQIKPCGISITLSCGELSYEEYAYLKQCGADRYLLKHETSDKALYSTLHPGGSLENRVRCLRDLKTLSYETGGGFMIGLPGQTIETIANDLLLLRSIPCDMAGIGPFIPSPDTSLCNAIPGSTELTLRAVALARILLPTSYLPATTALGVAEAGKKTRVFSCGANVIMQKITPREYRNDYKIYPADIRYLDIKEGRIAVEQKIREMGRIPV